MAAPRLSPSSSSSSSNVNISADNILPRFFCLQPLRTSRTAPRASASCVSAAEREREREKERTKGSGSYHCSIGSGGGGKAMAVETLYDVLEVAAEASAEEIKAAYRKLARSCHPDVVKTEKRSSATTAFMRIRAAYVTLSDPEKRVEYDRRRRPSASESLSSSSSYSPSYPGSPSPTSGYRRRTWETDQCW